MTEPPLAPSFRSRLGKALRRLLTIQAPASEQEAAVMRDQASLLYFLCVLFSATGIVNCLFIASNFRPYERPLLAINAAFVILCYAGVFAIARHWRRDRDDLCFLRRAQALFIGLGLGWGCLLNLFGIYGAPSQTALILGLASGVVSTPIISVPFAVAFGFFIPNAILAMIAVTFSLPSPDPVAATAFASFTLYSIVGIVSNNRAFGGRAEARAALQREVATVNVFLREYQEGSPDWLWETDAEGYLRNVVPNLAIAIGIRALELPGRRLQDLLTTEPPADGVARPARRDLAACLNRQLAFRDLTVTCKVGAETRWFALTGHPVYDGEGVLTGFRGIGRDITETREAGEKLAFMARHDGLTGLLNRKAFVSLVEENCQKGRPFALAVIDLDGFKGINDTYGHQMGDSLLQYVACRIRSELRPEDIGGRLGGDEFAIFLPGLDSDRGHAVAQRLATVLSEPFDASGVTIQPGASLGVAAAPAHGNEAQRLLMLADLALYRAKEQGKGSACRFEDAIEQEYRNRLLQEAELSRAIDDGEIVVAYQPVVDISTGQVVSAEALVRWKHPVRGMIMPGAFVPAAERSNLIDRLGEVVLRLACRDAAAWHPAIQVNVNLSPRQLRSGHWIPLLSAVLADSGLPPERLAIEVTETLLLERTEDVLAQLRAIRALGVKLVLDDFGTGYSSLSYLQDIDVDGIKLDASFTRKLPARKVAAICRMIARLAADLNVYVVAEGVEDAGQLEWLRQNGIHFAQGYLLGRPETAPPALKVEYLA